MGTYIKTAITWLSQVQAQQIWMATGPAGPIRAYLIEGHVVLWHVYPDHSGWQMYVPSYEGIHSGKTLAAVAEALKLKTANRNGLVKHSR